MNEKLRILIVENHALLRAGLRALLVGCNVDVVGEAANGHEAIQAAKTVHPSLVLIDIAMPGMNGIEAMIDMKRRCPELLFIVVTMHKEEDYIHASLRAGANGYLLKDSTIEELQVAIKTVVAGKIYLSPDLAGTMIKRMLNCSADTETSATVQLTHRERQVLKLIAEGHRNKYIAEYFSLSVKTVEKHRSNLMQKLDLHNSSRLTSYAIQHGLLNN